MPQLLPRMKQERYGLCNWINAGKVWPLLSIASRAAPSKIGHSIIRRMLLRRDVFDMERRFVIILVYLAVFAAIPSPGDHLSTSCRVYHVMPPRIVSRIAAL